MKKNKKSRSIDIKTWTLEFTKKTIVWVTILYSIVTAVALFAIIYGTVTGADVSLIDSVYSEACDVFKVTVSSSIIKSMVENIFKYNDFFGNKKEIDKGVNTASNEETVSDNEIEDL